MVFIQWYIRIFITEHTSWRGEAQAYVAHCSVYWEMKA